MEDNMAFLNDAVLDAALDEIIDNVTTLYICSAEPATYAEASSTYALGSKASPTVGTKANGSPSGRQCTVSAISDGSVSDTGTATHWALTSGTVLYAAEELSSSQAVTEGNDFTLTSFTITIPDPA
jgi:hypothetical protein